ncbi:hypothetical protein [Christiangramia crocea]|uniref:Uncharacterized protein n=1 Tax=Christiangramia crocea TaxID=2904124 RepID=A0A9X1UVC4_9FLAO|nr:hypothetical protein [Gramella crocea]MCG9970985.1 hypothetical protein [Gramella crocea]
MEQVDIYDFNPIGRGTYFKPMTFQILDGASNPIDITGATLTMHGKKDANGSVVIDFAPVVSDGVNGEITIPGFVADYPVYQYVYDLFVSLNGEPKKYLKGKFTIAESVSI